jgi:hypothetical protein
VGETSRIFEAAKSAFAAIGMLFVATVASGGVTAVEPHGGWTTFVSGALWIGLPIIVGISHYRK